MHGFAHTDLGILCLQILRCLLLCQMSITRSDDPAVKALITYYHFYPKYLDGQARADSVNPDQMLQNAASDQGFHCLLLIQQFLDKSAGIKIDLFKS